MGQAALKLEAKPELLSISEIAKRCKIDRVTCAKRLEDLGYEPDPTSTAKLKLFPFDESLEFEIKSAKDTVSAMKIRDLRATAQIKEMKLAEARGELVPAHEVVEIVQSIVSTIYQEYTTRQPKRIGSHLAKAKNVAQVRLLLKKDSDKVMKMLRENFEKFIG